MKPVGSVVIPAVLLSRMRVERDDRLPRETGGFLLGLRRGSNIEVSEFTPQGAMDVAGPVSFERVDPEHQRRAIQAWERAEGMVGLVGDWHTHPAGQVDPSATDRSAWRTLVRSMHASGVGVILGAEEAAVFALSKDWRGLKVEQFVLLSQDHTDLVFGRPNARP